jgi:hypothetical protein
MNAADRIAGIVMGIVTATVIGLLLGFLCVHHRLPVGSGEIWNWVLRI